eukprot:567958-Amphidinium_carterae.1
MLQGHAPLYITRDGIEPCESSQAYGSAGKWKGNRKGLGKGNGKRFGKEKAAPKTAKVSYRKILMHVLCKAVRAESNDYLCIDD